MDEVHSEIMKEAEETYLESEFLINIYRRIISFLDSIGVWDMVKNDEKDFKTAVADYLLLNDYINKDLSNDEIKKISEEIMMEFLS